ncbi:hypothetical protein PV779_39285 [Streptomyces sp. ID01-9D]|nr:hypothetical protein [Streptomyces sp. ID01-9D]
MIDDDAAVADGSEPTAPANLRAPYSESPSRVPGRRTTFDLRVL